VCFHCGAPWPPNNQHICPVENPLGFLDSGPETFQNIPRASPNDGDRQRKRQSSSAADKIITMQIGGQTKGKGIIVDPLNSLMDGAKDNEPERPNDPNFSQNNMDVSADTKKSEISGVVVILDDLGWKQKILVSYDLSVQSVASLSGDRVFSFLEMPRIEVSVPESTYAGHEFRAPQFSIQQITLQLGPSVDQIGEDNLRDDYTDSWFGKEQYPSVSTYATVRKSTTSETSTAGTVEISVMPKASIQTGRKRGYSHDIPGESAGIDVTKCAIDITPVGGFKWKYVLLKDSSWRSRSRFESHRGEISVSEYFPSSIHATVSAILETTNTQPFAKGERCRGIAIGYRHIGVVMQTDVMWDKDSYAQFPCRNIPSGHQVKLKHQFREGPGNWVVPPKRVFPYNRRLETELSLRGISDPAREI